MWDSFHVYSSKKEWLKVSFTIHTNQCSVSLVESLFLPLKLWLDNKNLDRVAVLGQNEDKYVTLKIFIYLSKERVVRLVDRSWKVIVSYIVREIKGLENNSTNHVTTVIFWVSV